MKFESDNLAQVVNAAALCIKRTNYIPIMSCVLLSADKNMVRITGSDLEIQIIASAPANVIEKGECVVNAAALAAIVKNAPPGQINVSANDSTANITTAGSRHRLNVLPARNYPVMDEITCDSVINLKADDLSEMLGLVHHAAAKMDVRQFLNGVYFQIESGAIILTASDGHRMAQAELFGDGGGERAAIVPTVASAMVAKLFKNGDVSIAIDRDMLRISSDNLQVTAKCVAGKYPSVSASLNQQRNIHVTVDHSALKDALSMCMATVGTHEKAMIKVATDEFKIVVNDDDGQESISTINCDYSDLPIDRAYNIRYLQDAIGKGDGVVRFEFGESVDSSVVVKNSAHDAINLIMPIRI